MSAISTHPPTVVADGNRQTNDSDTTADALIQGDPVAVERLIAHVLGRAHRMAETLNAPDEARAILEVAHSFADELAIADPGFDRLRFIEAVTDRPS
jgi:hypothetical protein